MALTDDELALVRTLEQELADGATYRSRCDAYYNGVQRLEQLGLAIPPELRRFVTVVAWPQLAVDAVEERLDVVGFRRPGVEEADDELWRVWQANDLDTEAPLLHTDTLVYREAYTCVGSREGQPELPLVTVETPDEVTVHRDPRTREVTEAGRFYDVVSGRPTSATLYLPTRTSYLERTEDGWAEVDRDEHNLGEVPVVPFVNRPRTGARAGVSELAAVISLTDAAARALTNLQVAQETHAVPQRVVLGATAGDFVDQQGNMLTAWEAYFGAVWTIGNPDAKATQFTSSDLRNFHDTVSHYAKLVGGLTGLPPHYLGMSTENPASADAIRSSEARLVRRVKRKQRILEGSHERTMRLVDRFRNGGRTDPDLLRLETLWADPETPTRAQTTDAVVKLVQSGVLPVEAAWEELGYGPLRREQLRELREQQASDPTLERIARDLSAGATTGATAGAAGVNG